MTFFIFWRCSAIGSALIVGGLYMVLWGKGSEMSRPAALVDGKSEAEITAKGSGLKSDTADSNWELMYHTFDTFIA